MWRPYFIGSTISAKVLEHRRDEPVGLVIVRAANLLGARLEHGRLEAVEDRRYDARMVMPDLNWIEGTPRVAGFALDTV